MKAASGSFSSSMWNPVGSSSSSSGAFNNQASSQPELTEDELERQYAAYKAQFEEWIEKNRNHPDRDAYNRYVNQFKEWETQVETNRRAIREWKAKRSEQHLQNPNNEQASTSKNTNGATAINSDTSSPSLSAMSGKKKKKLKKKKKVKDTVAEGGEGENPMMAMMKMMASTMASSGVPTPAPVQPAMPMDPFSMMMAMTMMMPMMMNSTPTPPTMEASPAKSTTTSSNQAIPDLSKPPPTFQTSIDGDRSKSRFQQQSQRDHEFRLDRSQRRLEPDAFTPRLDRSPIPLNQRLERDSGRRPNDEDGDGDYWYQRWRANRNQEPAGPPQRVDPWLPARQPIPPHLHGPVSLQPQASGPPMSLWPPAGASIQPPGMILDRDLFNNRDDPPYVNRSHFGSRDFSMRKHQSRWN